MQEPNPPKTSDSWQTIILLIQSKIDYLEFHLQYLADFEKGVVSQDELREYLAGIFSYKCKKKEQIQTLVTGLKIILSATLDEFKLFKNLTLLTPTTLAAHILYVHLQLHLSMAIKADFVINIDFNDKYVCNSIIKILPSVISHMTAFTKHFQIKLPKSKEKRSQDEYSLSVDWTPLLKDLLTFTQEYGPFIRSLSEQDQSKYFSNSIASVMNSYYVLPEIRNQMAKNNSYQGNIAEYIQDNCKLFIKYIDIIEDFKKIADIVKVIKTDKQYLREVTSYYQEARETVKQRIQLLLEEHADIKQNLTKLIELKLIPSDELRNQYVILAKLEEKIGVLGTTAWPEQIPLAGVTVAQIKGRLDSDLSELDSISKTIMQIQDEAVNCLEVYQKKQADTNAKLAAERASFLANQAEMSARYKEEIQNKRAAKVANKIHRATPHADVETITYKNIDIELKLNNLSYPHLLLIEKIHKLEKGCTYDEIINLIEKHLGGRVMSVGNGSSHRRIVLDKYTMDIIHKDDQHQQFDAHTKATGGMFDPHGKPHNPGLIIGFNLRLVRAVFIKAGISLLVVQNLLNKIAPDPVVARP